MKLASKTMIMSRWSPPLLQGGPLHFYNVFAGVDPSSYVIVTRADILESAVGPKARWLPAPYYFIDTDASKDSLAAALQSAPDPQTSPNAPHRPLRRRILAILRKIPLVPFLLDFLDLLRFTRQFVRRGLEVAKAENIQSILALSDDGPALLGAFIVHLRTGIPFSLYFFDLFRNNPLGPARTIVARIAESRLLRRAQGLIVTNDTTAEYYRNLYGSKIRCLVLYNSVFVQDYPQPDFSSELRPPFKIVFAGMVYWAQAQAVDNLLRAMHLLKDLPVQLDLYVLNASEALKKAAAETPNTTLGIAAGEEMGAIQSRASVLFLPFAWNSRPRAIIETATPSKMTSYLASGRPILVHAPDYACASRLTRRYRLGTVVDANDPAALALAVRDLVTHPKAAMELAVNARTFFLENCSAETNSPKLIAFLNSAASEAA